MIRRQCPNCGTGWYSANTIDWECPECGTVLTAEHDLPLEQKKNEPKGGDPDARFSFLRQQV